MIHTCVYIVSTNKQTKIQLISLYMYTCKRREEDRERERERVHVRVCKRSNGSVRVRQADNNIFHVVADY